jgi:hypothetical protein
MRLIRTVQNTSPVALAAFAVALIISPAPAANPYTIDIIPVADASFLDNDVNGTFEELRLINPFGLQTTYFDQGVNDVEVRSVLEYDLSAIPFDKPLKGASLVASVEGTQTPFGFTELSMYLSGYSGDGQITFADITATTTPLGEYVVTDPLFSSGIYRYSAALDLGYVSSVLAAGGFLGIMTNSDLDAGSISIHSLEGYYPEPFFANTESVLRLQFVPEPSSMTLLLAGLGLSANCLRKRSRRYTK